MDVLDRTPPVADHRIHYGAGAMQFGDLWLPKEPRGPLVVFLHGGWWRVEYGLAYGGHLCAALRDQGLAVWSIEYRRLGNGGGWPGTFQDVAAGYDYVTTLARQYPLNLTRVMAAGHSAGGQLAFWLAGRPHIPHGSVLAEPQPRVPLRAVVGLAAAVDLRLTAELAGYFRFAHDKDEVYRLMGGSPEKMAERYRAGDPGDLLPLGVPQVLIQGTEDSQIPPALPERWAAIARRQGDSVRVVMIPDADHFDVVDPQSRAWPAVQDAIRSVVSP